MTVIITVIITVISCESAHNQNTTISREEVLTATTTMRTITSPRASGSSPRSSVRVFTIPTHLDIRDRLRDTATSGQGGTSLQGRENMTCQEIPRSAGAQDTPRDLRDGQQQQGTGMFTTLRDRNPSGGSPLLRGSDHCTSLSYLTTRILIMTLGLLSRQGKDPRV